MPLTEPCNGGFAGFNVREEPPNSANFLIMRVREDPPPVLRIAFTTRQQFPD